MMMDVKDSWRITSRYLTLFLIAKMRKTVELEHVEDNRCKGNSS